MDSDEPLQPISSNSPIPIVLIKITQYTVTISPVSPKIRGRKSEQHKRKQHEDNRQKYHTILSRSYLYTGKIPEYHRQIHPRHPHLHCLAAAKYMPSSANSMLIALNGFFGYTGWHDCFVTIFKTQPNHIYAQEKEMMRAEYEKLIATAKENGNLRLAMIIEIIGSTGMRISELASVTVEAVSTGKISISCKGKHREIYLIPKLKRKLLDYCKKKGIRSGAVFITKNGNPVDRSNIWTEMKKNAEKAGVALEKAFPHNLRHFFARVYYSIHKNISQLADILGHSSINTTRIYLATTEEDHVKKLERLDLVV